MEQHNLKKVNNYLNTNIYSCLETSGGQSCNLYLNVFHFFNTSVNKTSVTEDCCFPALASNRRSYIQKWKRINEKQSARWQHLSQLIVGAFLVEIFYVSCKETQQLMVEIGNTIWCHCYKTFFLRS